MAMKFLTLNRKKKTKEAHLELMRLVKYEAEHATRSQLLHNRGLHWSNPDYPTIRNKYNKEYAELFDHYQDAASNSLQTLLHLKRLHHDWGRESHDCNPLIVPVLILVIVMVVVTITLLGEVVSRVGG